MPSTKRTPSKVYKHLSIMLIMMLAVLIPSACSDDNHSSSSSPTTQWHTHKVAIVLPMDHDLDSHWQHTLQLFSDNLKLAFSNQNEGISLEFEWFDENSSNLKDIAQSLAKRDDILAVLGGHSSTNADILASELFLYGKPLFSFATSEEFIRRYAKEKTLWALIESDISQCEALLTRALYYNATKVALIANENSLYGKTFIDWFAFQAQELGLEVTTIANYKDDDLSHACSNALSSGADYVICTPSETNELEQILKERDIFAQETGSAPQLLFSDTGYGANVLSQLGNLLEGAEGVSFTANPESGFNISYKVYFDDEPTLFESQLYDAAMLIAYAAYARLLDSNLDFLSALCQIVDGRDNVSNSWMAAGMREVINALAQGQHPDIQGASGSLDFDAKTYTNVLSTVYQNYKVYNGNYIILDYCISDGSKRVSSTLAGWNWQANDMQDFDNITPTTTYPDLDKQWAVIIAASNGWANYRHQADALNMYQILKTNGYSDDNIILIIDDDIAFNTYNTHQGIVTTSPNGTNLYDNVIIDYHTSDLTPNSITDILCGNTSNVLPTTINSDYDDNVLLFWSGHGSYGEFCWLDEMQGFTSEMAYRTISKMSSEHKFRKMLCLIETCYSGSVVCDINDINGFLAITAAAPNETSKADLYDKSLRVWMTNRFTRTLHEAIVNNPHISIHSLYNSLFKNTVGSHVMVYNAENYGNLYNSSVDEFITHTN